jgi:radical SAM protein with 4Fe4S-binding SPASM domain
MKLGIILVHGYSGSKQNLKPLAESLIQKFGPESVNHLSLPSHGEDPSEEKIPEFDEDIFIKAVFDAFSVYQREGRKIIIMGHSTGGSLVLATLHQFSLIPDLLILLAVPKKIGPGYFERWESHQGGKKHLSMVNVAFMVKFINKAGQIHFNDQFPVLVIHGDDDRLVLCNEAPTWSDNFPKLPRIVTIPKVDHDIFQSVHSNLVIDIIQRALFDIVFSEKKDSNALDIITAAEPGLKHFFEIAPLSQAHVTLCPSGQQVLEKQPDRTLISKNDPVIANIEITTYCNLDCQFCARSELNKRNKHMPFELFRNILSILPNTYKIVLVGLGEPLLHPEIVDFIKYAKSQGRKVGMVTNAMLLNPNVSYQLLEAGLDSIAFSIDGSNETISSEVRKGTNFQVVIQNIKEFVKISNQAAKTSPYMISKAVFSAVSIDTVAYLKDLVDRVLDLGVDVLMLSDINFKANIGHTLWKNTDDIVEEKVRKGISHAFTNNLPVLSVHGLEEFGLEKRYHDFLMIPPSQLYQRSATHKWCFSPWQTIPVDVEGKITLCDCQPNFIIGNLLEESFTDIWNGQTLQQYRGKMISDNPPEACKICPRF